MFECVYIIYYLCVMLSWWYLIRVVSHFYGRGDVCDLTGNPRQVTVKLKWDIQTSWYYLRCLVLLNAATNTYLFCLRCKESESPHAVTVYMLEPQTCQYVLGVSGKHNVFEVWLHFFIFMKFDLMLQCDHFMWITLILVIILPQVESPVICKILDTADENGLLSIPS